ncbi:MAG: TonB-dependent receptor [Mariniphaga sp.]
MKLLTFILFVSVASVAGNSYSQQTKFTLNLIDRSVYQVFQEIEKTSEFIFLYSEKSIDLDRKIDIKVEDENVKSILDQLFKGTNNDYEIHDRQIVILSSEKIEFQLLTESIKEREQPQKREITGTVSDPKGIPLPGVSVVVKGTTTGTVTDNLGKFSVTLPTDAKLLTFSFVGMRTQDIVIGEKTSIHITLAEEIVGIDEVVAIGYGTVKKSDLTGSVATIKSKDLDNVKVGLVSNAIQGLAPGVLVQQGSQKPGGGASILIRGQGTLNAGSAPLVIVDGVPDNIDDLTSSNIASIEVLKDASSASIYGSRGSNGVILVTTKQGQKGKSKVSFNSNFGSQSLMNKQHLMNADQYYEIVNKVQANYPWSSDELRYLTNGKSTDWQDELSRKGNYQNYNLSMSGGSEETNHFLSIDWYTNKGIIKNSSFTKANVVYNMNTKINDFIRSGIRFKFIETTLKNVNEDALDSYGTMHGALMAQPTAPTHGADGKYFDNFLNSAANPLAMVELMDKPTDKTRLVGSAYLEFEPIKNLIFKTDNGGEATSLRSASHTEPTMGQHYQSAASVYYARYIFMQSENTLTYNLKLNNHKLNLLGGFSASKGVADNATAIGTSVNPVTGYNNIGGAATFGPDASGKGATTMTSYFSRLNYSFAEKYLATFTMRADGSSRFAPGHQWGYFPSAAIKWRASEEEFVKKISFISNLGLRLSAGMLGNQDIGDYRFYSSVMQGGNFLNYPIGGAVLTGASQVSMGNPNLTWEKAKTLDLGIDFGFFENRISGSLEAYYKRTSDLLWEVPLPKESGYNTSLTNVGTIDNKGIEFSLNSVNLKGKLAWTTSLNFTYNKNNVVDLYDNKTNIDNWLFVGKPIGVIYSYEANGIWQQNEADKAAIYNAIPGDRKVIDKNNDNLITDKDRDFHGETRPVYFGSIQNTFKYAGFDLNLLCTYAGGYKIHNTISSWLDRYNVWGNMSESYYNGYWTPQRPSMIFPAPRTGALFTDGGGTDAFYQNGSYLRIKNLELGYNLPQRLLKPIKASNIRVFASVQNLYTFTEFTGYDVESDSYNNPYPAARTYIFGISANF